MLGHLETFLTAREAAAATPRFPSGRPVFAHHARARSVAAADGKRKGELDEQDAAREGVRPGSGSSVAAARRVCSAIRWATSTTRLRPRDGDLRSGAKLTERSEPAAPGVTVAGARTSDADVGGVQAALQLLAHLTKRHSRAKTVLDRGCVR